MPQANHFDCILHGLIFYFHKQNYPNRAIRVYMYAWIGTLKPYFTFLTNTFYFIFFRTWWTVCPSFCSSENGEASQLCQKSCWDCCSAFHHKWQGIYIVILLKSEFQNVNPLMSPKKIRLLNLKINITLKIAVVVGVIAIVRCCWYIQQA